MKNLMLVFPGQGSQYIGMGKNLYDNFSFSKKIFEEIDNAIEFKISKLIFEGDENELRKTSNTQIALMAVSIAAFEALKQTLGENFQNLNIKAVAGHSLGEYSALCAAEAISLIDCAKILQKRGEIMIQSSSENSGMVAILGSDKNTIQTLIDNIKEFGILVIANNNCPGQIVISGHLNKIDEFIINANKLGIKKIIKLPVSGAFHSPLMQNAQNEMKEFLMNLQIQKPKWPIIQNYSIKAETQIEQIKNNLIHQITAPVLWQETIEYAIKEFKIDTFIELGAKNVLSNLIKRISSISKIFNIENKETLENFINDFAKSK